MRRILITGATGFIGRRLTEKLARAGYFIRAAVRRPALESLDQMVEVVSVHDLQRTVEWMPLVEGMDAVIHLAGIAHASDNIGEDQYDRVNRIASTHLAAAATAAGIKQLVFASSIRAQCGACAIQVQSENNEPQPTDAYGRSKLAAEAAIKSAGVPFTILRPVLIVDVGAKGNLRALRNLARLPVPLPFGNFTNRRSLISLDDFIGAVMFVLKHERTRGETFVVAHPQSIAVADMIASLRSGLGRPPRLFNVPARPIRAVLSAFGKEALWDRLNGELIVDPAKLMVAGWRPAISPSVALSRMVD